MSKAERLIALVVAFGLIIGLAMSTTAAAGTDYIVRDGQPMAEIVVPEKPASSVVYAARELQTYVEKISGAKLPIVPPFALTGEKGERLQTQYPPDAERMPVRIYLGQNFHTERLGVSVDDLDWGAYRMRSGDGWLALVGKDTEFIPLGVWGRSRNHWQTQGEAEWNEATGEHAWGSPVGASLWKRYHREFDLWSYDQKGTLNAVYAYLKSLGVRWYMPGELGEIVATVKTIELPQVDKTVKPACKIRKISFNRYGLGSINPEIQWGLRLGLNEGYGYSDYHGLSHVTRPEQTRQNHPDFYALYNGKRDIESRTANPCLSSQGLFEETLRYARFVFDMYDVPHVSVWPDDGFSSMCECPKCKGKDTPERGRQGVLSDYVWDFVNRVAIEVGKTHPDKYISCGAYSTYWLPPTKIDKLNSNVMVYIVNARRRYNIPEEDAAARRRAVHEWASLTDGKVISFMNYGGAANTPHIFAEDIKDLDGLIIGEDMWVAHHRGGLAQHGFNHLNYYVSASLWWDIDQDVDKLLDEYYSDFYGPAADEMKAFVNYYERHQDQMSQINSADIIKTALDLFDKAQAAVDPDSVYGKRLTMFSEGLERRRKFYAKIKDGRENPPLFVASKLTTDIKLDGKLDEKFWSELPGELKQIQTGEEVKYPTRFKIGVKDNYLYFGIKCFDEKGDPVNIAEVDRKDHNGLWNGDAVELLLETAVHSYYQIAINPAGTICDLDRSVPLSKAFAWGAEADVFTQINKAEGYWTIEARVPFTPSTQDPLHEMIGPRPSKDNPWYFNICRQRVRDEGGEVSAFSPTGERRFHNILKFGKLIVE